MRRVGCGAGLPAKISSFLIIPGGLVVGSSSGIEPGIESVLRQLETFLNNKRGVGVIDEIILGDAIVFDGIADQPAEESNIGAGANLDKKVGGGGSASETGINGNQFGVAIPLGLHGPLETAGMILRRVAAHDQHHVGVLDVDPAVGHRPASECWSQT